ncbi:MAG: saccharopine dehydrogenase, partial [Acidobacteria bacterium]|nr:saccharopine dehydrogenase [Acidobacteriota bacterium]NIO60954.1 saccharopine dehydrogenase [Acidobacteriota bacterium]NIT12598.1 saccharopine dehydrogenase [Acidobacteriota bacterium]
DRVAADTGADVERIVADATDRPALDALCASTRAVVSTVGPYALYGGDLVAAVAASGTDYCDLTGEPHWMRSMIDSHAAEAAESG